MQIATALAGFSMAEADILRKAMGKKKTAVMKAQKQRFIQGAKEKGLNHSKASKIFEQINYFAGYGFNKSHSAAYAYLAFRTAYLKTHYPVFFLAALLTSEAERGATSQLVKYINACKEMGIEVLPPDINASEFTFTESGGNIRFGLSAVKNVGEGAVQAILESRKKKGKFSSPFDIFKEVDSKAVNRKVIESLIKSGSLDSLGWKRSQLFHLVDKMIDYAHDLQKMKTSKQTSLFGQGQVDLPEVPAEIKAMREWDEALFLSYEKDALGFYITGHPLAQFGKNLKRLTSHFIGEVDENNDFKGEIRLAGIIASIKPLKTKKDERMATFILEDLTGRIEVVVFPDFFQKFYEHFREDLMVLVKGKFLGEGEGRRVHLSHIIPLAEAFEKQARRVVLKVFLPGLEETIFEELKILLDKHHGVCPVLFDLQTPHSYRMVVQSIEVQSVKPSEEFTKSVEALLGEDSVLIEY